MMGRQRNDQAQFFYSFHLQERVPTGHLLRRIDVFVTQALADIHRELAAFYSHTGRPSVDPELMVRSTATMLERTRARFGLKPKRLAADTAYGTGKFLDWLVGQAIEPHIPVWDKGSRDDGTFGRADFIFDPELDQYTCPAGKILKQFRRNYTVARTDSAHDGIRKYRASQKDCQTCDLKVQCCPNMASRNVLRSVHEEARDQARQHSRTPQFATSRNERKKVEMLFAQLRTTLRFERMRLRGLTGARDEFHLVAVVQNLRRMARLTAAAAP